MDIVRRIVDRAIEKSYEGPSAIIIPERLSKDEETLLHHLYNIHVFKATKQDCYRGNGQEFTNLYCVNIDYNNEAVQYMKSMLRRTSKLFPLGLHLYFD